jgi:hypothetical protein
MATFKPGVDTVVEAKDDSLLEVQVDRANPMPVGKHVFQLIVTDDADNKSTPATVTVIVLDTAVPTAVIDFVDSQGRTHAEPEVRISFTEKFALSGKRSHDLGGQVRMWTWTLLRP